MIEEVEYVHVLVIYVKLDNWTQYNVQITLPD
jgi:hypothetical protein